METKISVEQYFIYELVATFRAALAWVAGKNRNLNLWNKQLEKLKTAFDYFMLEMEVNEFKDLRLPSERKTKPNKKGNQNKDSKTHSGKSKIAKEGGKQLQLFFVKIAKRLLLILVEGVEGLVMWHTKLFFGRVEVFENRTKGRR